MNVSVNENDIFPILVLGAGHAGVEAAWIAAQLNLDVALITLPTVPIASTPCNPAIGGVGKGQVVREIDALGGLMGKLADLAGIHYRTLNASKGYAVRSTRVQVDKERYAVEAERLLNSNKKIQIIRDEVCRIDFSDGVFSCYMKWSYRTTPVKAHKLIITAGTFLNGKLHMGSENMPGGRIGHESTNPLQKIMQKVMGSKKRFKTGTPPRLLKDSLNYSCFTEQGSDEETLNFHCLQESSGSGNDKINGERKRNLPQISCYIAHTNPETMGIIRKNKEKSPLFNGQIKGIGPRYCPSIEDKAFRYPDRNVHHVFIEPEGLKIDTIYPNGVSTSLPQDIQQEFIQTIPGLETATIKIPGYAVEYDVVDTDKLDLSLQSKDMPGLYFAGQINGTSGYEEAAAQGIIAGINAALSYKKRDESDEMEESELFVLDRNSSYIGVLIDDLVHSLHDEPYRLFTARSENRLYIREDNAFIRMWPYRQKLQVQSDYDVLLGTYIEEYELLKKLCETIMFENKANLLESFQKGITLSEAIKKINDDVTVFLEKELLALGAYFRKAVVHTTAIEMKYSGYIHRSDKENMKLNRITDARINWQKICESPNISFECKTRIKEYRPKTLSQLKKIAGIRPATLLVVAGQYL